MSKRNGKIYPNLDVNSILTQSLACTEGITKLEDRLDEEELCNE